MVTVVIDIGLAYILIIWIDGIMRAVMSVLNGIMAVGILVAHLNFGYSTLQILFFMKNK